MSKFYKGCGPQKLGCAVKLDGSNGHEGGAPFINPGIAAKMAKGVMKVKQVITDKAKEYDAKDGKEGNVVSQFINDAGSKAKSAAVNAYNKLDDASKHAGTGFSNAPGSPFKKKGPCWEGYEMIGMKNKNGKKVPNCVPK